MALLSRLRLLISLCSHVLLILVKSSKYKNQLVPSTDPGFPRRGVNPKWGCQPIIWPKFAENCMKIELGRRRACSYIQILGPHVLSKGCSFAKSCLLPKLTVQLLGIKCECFALIIYHEFLKGNVNLNYFECSDWSPF